MSYALDVYFLVLVCTETESLIVGMKRVLRIVIWPMAKNTWRQCGLTGKEEMSDCSEMNLLPIGRNESFKLGHL